MAWRAITASRTVLRSTSSAATTSSSVPSANPTHAVPRATGVMAVTAAPRADTAVAPPHWHPSVGPGRYCLPRHRLPFRCHSAQETRVQSVFDDVASNIPISTRPYPASVSHAATPPPMQGLTLVHFSA
jgi:hypothetical protein